MGQRRINLSDDEELLLSWILNKPREFLIMHPGAASDLSKSAKKKFQAGRKKLKAGFPLAYILGFKWFRNNKFLVNQSVLIPRPDTELIVEKAVKFARQSKPDIIVDIGPGSGAIIISLAEELSKGSGKESSGKRHQKNKSTKFYAVDISAKALAIAKKNAKTILGRKNRAKSKKNKVTFLKGSLLSPLIKKLSVDSKNRSEKILIVSNLPYLSKKELKEKSIKHEPRLALYGGKKSHQKILDLLKQISKVKIIKAARPNSAAKNRDKNVPDISVLLEINYNQAKIIKAAAKKYLPQHQFKVYKDLGGYDRVIALQRKFRS